MAGTDAVAAVGLTLQALLADRIQNPTNNGIPLPVTLGPPGPERDPEGAAEDARINLFLYQVSENCFLKNQEIPGFGNRGAYGSPPLSLDLHYLLTVFGSTASGSFFDETPAHQLLGSAMNVLNDNSIVTTSVVTKRPPAGRLILDPALRDEHESIKVSIKPLGLEDLSNVWTALELSYRLSVAYEVTVVQIDSERPRRYPRIVQEPPGAGPRVFAIPIQRPDITALGVRRPGDPADSERSAPYARIGDTLILHGSRLEGAGLTVRIGRLDLPAVVGLSGETIEAVLPDSNLLDGTAIEPADRIKPGISSVSVRAVVPDLPQAAVSSAALPIVIVPSITSVSVVDRTLTVDGLRLTDGAAPGEILVGDTSVERSGYLPASTETSVLIPLSGALPVFPAVAHVSGDLDPFPALPGSFDMSVRVGGGAPHVVTLTSTPGSLEEAAAAVQAAILGATSAPGFDTVQVTATDRELIVVPADRTSSIQFSPGALANALALANGSSNRSVYLSGSLRRFPRLTNASPQVSVQIGGTTRVVPLGSVPASLTETAGLLEAALNGAAGVAGFADARVTALGDQLCILPGSGGAVTIGPVPGSDETTVVQLQLAARYAVRARVRGVESIDDQTVDLP